RRRTTSRWRPWRSSCQGRRLNDRAAVDAPAFHPRGCQVNEWSSRGPLRAIAIGCCRLRSLIEWSKPTCTRFRLGEGLGRAVEHRRIATSATPYPDPLPQGFAVLLSADSGLPSAVPPLTGA